MRSKQLSRLGALSMLGLLATGCETGTGPQIDEPLDAEAALADYEAVQGVLESKGWAGFQALGTRSPFSGPAKVVADLGAAPRQAHEARAFALDLARHMQTAAASSGTGAPIISDRHRGMTFVYDPSIDDYALDPDREGAPATGVRFILYEVDSGGRPVVDQEIGHADLVDEGDASLEDIVLHLIVLEGELTRLDYRTTVDVGEGTGSITVDGFLQGDDDRLDFEIAATGTDAGGRQSLDVDFEMGVDARGFSIVGSVHGVEEGAEGEGDVDVTVHHRKGSIRVAVEGADGQIDGSFFLNGNLFATVSGDAEEPTLLGASGDPITGLEFLVLRQMLDTVEDVFDFLEDLVDPVDELVILGIIL
jgi:hypothetical protein